MKIKIIGLLMLCLIMTGCMQAETKEDLTQTTYALGTVISINLYDQGDQTLMDELIARVGEIEQLMSAQLDTTEVSAVTAAAGHEAVAVSEATYTVIEKSLYYAELSDGSFDPTVGPIVSLWNIGTEDAHVPEADEIERALSLVDYKKVVLDPDAGTVYLKEAGMSLDLGGIAKGYVADALVKMLDEAEVERAMINLGGNVYAYGSKEGGDAFNVAIQTPFDNRNSYFGYVSVTDKTVVTSGPYERYFEEEGTIYHHIFDANTGWPVETDVLSVTLVADHSIDADALSTLLFTLPEDEGLALIETIEGIDCIYVDSDYRLTVSSGLKDRLVVTEDSYKLD